MRLEEYLSLTKQFKWFNNVIEWGWEGWREDGWCHETLSENIDQRRFFFFKRWASDDGRSLEKDAYIQLSRIYNLIANQMIRRTQDVEAEKNPKDEALNYFHKVSGNRKTFSWLSRSDTLVQTAFQQSYTVAYKAGDRTIESLASYKLGMMLLFSGYPRKCLKYLEVYLYFCQINGNDFGMARALEGIGRALHEQVGIESWSS